MFAPSGAAEDGRDCEMSGTDGKARIVVGVDGSESSNEALEWAARQAELTGSEIEAITAWQFPMSYGYPMPIPPDFDAKADATTVVEKAVGELRAAHPGVEIHTSVIEGHAAEVLLDASNGAALLVVGSRGHGQVAGMLLGSVSGHCAARAHCPVVVVRS